MLIIRTNNFIAEYIFEGISEETRRKHDVILHQPFKEKGNHRIVQVVAKYLAVHNMHISMTRFFSEKYLEELRTAGEKHDTILLFDIQNLKEILLYRHIFPNHKINVFVWNTARTFCRNVLSKRKYIRSTKKYHIHVSTFDDKDAAEYGFTLTRQPYRFPKHHLYKVKAEKDLFFVGLEKGRAEAILRFKRMTDSRLTSTFYIHKDKHASNRADMKELYHDKALSYPDTLLLIRKHKAYLEILQKIQHGTTLRPMEAMFLNRKIISTNCRLSESELYHPSRILILNDATTLQEVIQFLESDYIPLEIEIKNKYDINTWIKQFE